MSLNGKVAIVTGSSSGIGEAIAKKFIEESANVTIVGRNEAKLKTVADESEKLGNRPLIVVADMTKEEDVQKIIKETINKFGHIDILVNNAGIGGPTDILDENVMKKFDLMVNTNFRSVVYTTHLAAPYLIARKGNIVNISSVAGIRQLATQRFGYSTSKAALDMFTKCMASEFGGKGVRVNSVNPGPVKSLFIENMGMTKEQSDAMLDRYKSSRTVLERISEPEEIADLVLFLACDKARGITGSIFVSDNGLLLPKSE